MRYICIVPNYWGKGETMKEAKANCRIAGGTLKGRWIIYEVEDNEAYCESVSGWVMQKKGSYCKVIERHGPKPNSLAS